MGRTFLCVALSLCVHGVFQTARICVFFIPVPQGLTITAVSSLREGSISVGWGPRAESLLLLTNRGVSVENTRTHTHLICAGNFLAFSIEAWRKDFGGYLKIKSKVIMCTSIYNMMQS